MAESITLDIRAKIAGYEESIKQMKRALDQVDPGSAIGKKLTKALGDVEKKFSNLSKNLLPEISNSNQLQKLMGDVNALGDAIQDLGLQAQSISSKDLNFDALGDDVHNLINQLKEANNALGTVLGDGIKKFVNGSEELKQAFADLLDFDVANASPDEIFERITKAMKDSRAEVEKADKAYQQAEKSLKQLQDTQTTKEQQKTQIDNTETIIQEQSKKYLDSTKQLRADMNKQMKKIFTGADAEVGKEILDSFFKDLTPGNIQEKVDEAIKAINTALGSTRYNRTTFKNDFLGLARGQKLAKNQYVNSMIEAQGTIESEINKTSGITPAAAAKDIELINKGQIEKATDNAVKQLETSGIRVQREVEDVKNKIVEAEATLKAAGTEKTRAEGHEAAVNDLNTAIQDQINVLQQENAELQERITNLEQQLASQAQGVTAKIKQEAGGAGKSAEIYKFTTEEAEKYESALERVKNAEQALGRLKGVVQQWFSIYAVIRMTTKAIRNIINTLTNLDKVITEIAIVTNMTQSELWGQMDSYAKMAQTYAASIEGVYQVSQLYYQQGLQTADVMSLTEQTLKMARISGLDYAQATDYMTNAVRAFNMEMTDSQRVVDVYSAVAASSATNTRELAEAMSRTASSAYAVGSSFENTTAMMAVMIESTRESASNIGSSLKSIISRYGEMKADPSALVDSEGQEMSLNKVDKALQSVGISIHDAAGQFRDFDDVIMELAASWDTIDRNTQRYIATIMAGNRLIMLAVACAAFIIAQIKMA